MSDLETIYFFENEDGTEATYTTTVLSDAQYYARTYGCLLLARTFRLEDEELVEDWREKDHGKAATA